MQTATHRPTLARAAAPPDPRPAEPAPPTPRSTIAAHAAFLLARDDDGRAR